jgi:hypothetical protein
VAKQGGQENGLDILSKALIYIGFLTRLQGGQKVVIESI